MTLQSGCQPELESSEGLTGSERLTSMLAGGLSALLTIGRETWILTTWISHRVTWVLTIW